MSAVGTIQATAPQPEAARRIDPDPGALVEAIRAGDVRACARLITGIERGTPGLEPVLRELYRRGGRSRVVGVTGPPGAGKSTLIDRMIGGWRARGATVAVLAIDPSSPFTGGAVLGDRLRMGSHGGDRGVFIRSMASRGQLGGLARAAGDALTVLDAMPWDVVIVETVGVGQNETDIMRHASVVVLLQTPMGGDDVQASKAGITEIGDIFVVNKSDHPDAARTARHLQEMIALSHRLHLERPWVPPVVKTRATEGEGVGELIDRIGECFQALDGGSSFARERRLARVRHRVGEILREQFEKRVSDDGSRWLDALLDPILRRENDPHTVADQLFARMKH